MAVDRMSQTPYSWFLFRQLLGRELSSRYKATALGLFWYLIQPLLMLAVYTAVFNGVFKVRWPGVEDQATFALMLFAGLIVFNFFSEVLVSAPTLVTSQPNYVKKVVFPLEMLAAVRVAAAVVTALISLGILFSAQLVLTGHVSAWYLVAPLPLVSLVPFLLTIAWLMSALGVYLRDVGQVAGLVASIFLFISPIFFPSSAIPESMRFLVDLNPLVGPIEELRATTLHGTGVDFVDMVLRFAFWSVMSLAALRLFRRLSRGFADVL